VLGGLWHGANWTFIAWGAFHGGLLIVNHIWRQLRGPRPAGGAVSRVAGWLLTFTGFVVAGVFFRAPDIAAAGRLLQAMAGLGDAPQSPLLAVIADSWAIRHGYFSDHVLRAWFGAYWSGAASLVTLGVLAVMLLVPDTMELTNYREGDPQIEWRRSNPFRAWTFSPVWGLGLAALFAVAFVRLTSFNEFLYYQF
jgi:hypothetical protein